MLERNNCLPGILLELEKIVKQLSSSQLQVSGPNILKFVMVWAFRCEDQENHLEAFRQFANAIRSPINNLPNDSKTLGVRRYVSSVRWADATVVLIHTLFVILLSVDCTPDFKLS